jgi:hypothetical protein
MPKKTNKAAKTSLSAGSRKHVDIKKANNGFVVSSYSDKGEQVFVAKNKTEAKKHANKLLKF